MATANYVLLERIELNASTASVTFSNIPQSGYTDLMLVTSTRVTDATGDDFLYARFNSSASGYSGTLLRGNGSTAASGTIGTTYAYVGQIEGTSRTSNTFTNNTCYIPNYLGSSQKSYSTDTVTENNATAAYAAIIAGLWTGTAAISTIDLTPASGSFTQYSTFSLYGLAATGTTPVIAPKASGGNITTDGTYWYHTFLASGTFIPSNSLSCDLLVIAGGGGGGNDSGGGGGAGGLLGFTSQALTTTGYAVTVGAGGIGAFAPNTNGVAGSDSQFGALTLVKGGGYGGSNSAGYLNVAGDGAPGGSGGGAGGGATSSGPHAVGTATSGQGNNGGLNYSTGGGQRAGGGGGGAGAVGGNGAVNNFGGNGGNGSSAYSSWGSATSTGQNVSSTYYYAGGGGGTGAQGFGVTPGTGGYGGGAAGSNGSASNGTANTGGGGGATANSTAPAGSGGSGIVIVRYTVA